MKWLRLAEAGLVALLVVILGNLVWGYWVGFNYKKPDLLDAYASVDYLQHEIVYGGVATGLQGWSNASWQWILIWLVVALVYYFLRKGKRRNQQ